MPLFIKECTTNVVSIPHPNPPPAGGGSHSQYFMSITKQKRYTPSPRRGRVGVRDRMGYGSSMLPIHLNHFWKPLVFKCCYKHQRWVVPESAPVWLGTARSQRGLCRNEPFRPHREKTDKVGRGKTMVKTSQCEEWVFMKIKQICH